MQSRIKHVVLILILATAFANCKDDVDYDGKSLQTYFEDSKETVNFISQDMPMSMLEIDDSQFTDAQKEAYISLKSFSFLGYKVNDTNTENFKKELAEVKRILKGNSYTKLMDFTNNGKKIVVKYMGDFNNADELVVLGSDKETGFGIIRILGEDMNLIKMRTLREPMQDANVDKNEFKSIISFFE